MKIKKANLQWMAMCIEANTETLKFFNIFNVIGPLACNWADKNFITWEQCIAYVIKRGEVANREGLKDKLEIWLKAMYWCRYQWEMVVKPYTDRETKEHKIDVWEQLEPNLDRIVDYVISAMDIKFKEE